MHVIAARLRTRRAILTDAAECNSHGICPIAMTPLMLLNTPGAKTQLTQITRARVVVTQLETLDTPQARTHTI